MNKSFENVKKLCWNVKIKSCSNGCDKEKIGSFINFHWASLYHALIVLPVRRQSINNKSIAKRHHPANDLFIIQHIFFRRVLRNFFWIFFSYFVSHSPPFSWYAVFFFYFSGTIRGNAYIIFVLCVFFFPFSFMSRQTFVPSIIRSIQLMIPLHKRPSTCKWRQRELTTLRQRRNRLYIFFVSLSFTHFFLLLHSLPFRVESKNLFWKEANFFFQTILSLRRSFVVLAFVSLQS